MHVADGQSKTRTVSRLGKMLAGAVMFVMLLAGAGKLLDLSAFRRSLLTWEYLPDWMLDVSWLGLPLAEALLPVLWFAGIRRRMCERAMLALLASMLAVVTLHWLKGANPTCNCLGALTRHLTFISEVRFMVTKAGVLLGVLLLAHVLLIVGMAKRGATSQATALESGATKSSATESGTTRNKPGFTLIEMLVVIAVIGTLVGLTIVGLSGARGHARRAKTLALLQQHGGILAVYATDWQDYFPAFVDAANPPYIFDAVGETIEMPVYFAANGAWFWALKDRYYDGQSLEVFRDAEDIGNLPGGRGTFDMSCTLFAAPEFWAPETRVVGISQVRGVHHADVMFPSQKTTLVSQFQLLNATAPGDLLANPASLTVGIPTLAADGHAEGVSARQFIPGVQMADAVYDTPGITMHWQDVFVGLHTYKGVRGRDWK